MLSDASASHEEQRQLAREEQHGDGERDRNGRARREDALLELDDAVHAPRAEVVANGWLQGVAGAVEQREHHATCVHERPIDGNGVLAALGEERGVQQHRGNAARDVVQKCRHACVGDLFRKLKG